MASRPKKVGLIDAALSLRDGRQLAYSDIGFRRAPTVLYLHGNPGSRSEMLRPQYVEAFLAASVRVISIDRPGYGDSDPPCARGHLPFTEDVRELMDHLSLRRAVVVGHSRGTLPALSLGVVLPERIGAVAAFGPTGLPDDPQLLRAMAPTARAMLQLVKSAPATARRLIRLNALLDRRFPRGAAARIARVLKSPADRTQLLAADSEFVERLALGMRRDPGFAVDDWRSWLVDPLGFDPTRIRVPVRFWTGTEDQACPSASVYAMARRIPTATVRSLPGVGHLHRPDILLSLIEETLAAAH